jgi:hypothetical protein
MKYCYNGQSILRFCEPENFLHKKGPFAKAFQRMDARLFIGLFNDQFGYILMIIGFIGNVQIVKPCCGMAC